MAKKTKSQNAELTVAQNTVSVVEETKTTSQKLILAKQNFGRWFVYFKGVPPKDNVGCGCKTAKSALRYMFMLKARYGAAISQNVYDRLMFEAAKES